MIGIGIAKLRQDREWTQRHLADLAGVDPQNLSKIELCKLSPRSGTIERLAKAFGVSVPDLYAAADSANSSRRGARRRRRRRTS